MAKPSVHGLMETKGSFQLRGIVTNTDKDEFYKEGKTRNGNPKRSVKFGVKYEKDSSVNVELQGFTRKEVFFNKRAAKKGEKSVTERVPWADRFNFSKEGFRLIGVNCGVKKITNSEGRLENDKKVLTEFDACSEIGANLKDDESVFVRGNLEFSSFDGENGKIRFVRLTPNQVSLCRDVEFDEENFKPIHDFTQTIIFMGISQETNGDVKTGRYVVEAKIVTYSSIEDAEFIIENSSLANIFRKNLKPYNAITVWGKITTHTQTDMVEEENDDVWGESNDMVRVSAPTRREFVITGADKSSLDRDVYSQEAVEEAITKINNAQAARNDFGGTSNDNTDSDWGSPVTDLSGMDLDDEDEAW